MSDEITSRYLEDTNYEAYPLHQRLDDCVQDLTLKTLEFEELQGKNPSSNNT